LTALPKHHTSIALYLTGDTHAYSSFSLPKTWTNRSGIRLKEITLAEDGKKQESSEEYEALSYAWGAPSREWRVDCKGKAIFVTENCYNAMQYLRKGFEARCLWIDAICIDQTSDVDKYHQLQFMGSVFAAELIICYEDRVVEWLKFRSCLIIHLIEYDRREPTLPFWSLNN
jgi:hypothetical protein